MEKGRYDIGRIEPLKQTLSRYLKESGVGWMLKHRDVMEAWHAVVEDEVAAHTRVDHLRNGTLNVTVDSPALCAELEQFAKNAVLRGVRERLQGAAVRDIRFRYGALPAGPEGPEAAPKGTEEC